MGICQSGEEKELELRTRQIDRELQLAHSTQQKVTKLLLLGSGGCGKSTILKQIRILHNHGFSSAERECQKCAVHSNTVFAMAALLRGMDKLHIALSNQTLLPLAQLVLDTERNGSAKEALDGPLVHAIKCLWADRQIREELFARRNEFQLAENTEYFLDALERTSQPNYSPTDADILQSRVPTTGVVEMHFKMRNMSFRVTDVGGQRSERKKWIHCFDDTDAVIFLSAISEFDQVLDENPKFNRLVESLRLFSSICSVRWLQRASMILFLNKRDLFAEKVQTKSIRVCFGSYKGPDTFDEQVHYVRCKFERLNSDPNRHIYTHLTCATDTNQIQIVLNAVIDFIIQKNLKNSMA